MSLFGIKAIAGAVVGGFGSIPGALIGCLIIGAVSYTHLTLPTIYSV